MNLHQVVEKQQLPLILLLLLQLSNRQLGCIQQQGCPLCLQGTFVAVAERAVCRTACICCVSHVHVRLVGMTWWWDSGCDYMRLVSMQA